MSITSRTVRSVTGRWRRTRLGANWISRCWGGRAPAPGPAFPGSPSGPCTKGDGVQAHASRQARWRRISGRELVPLVRAGATFSTANYKTHPTRGRRSLTPHDRVRRPGPSTSLDHSAYLMPSCFRRLQRVVVLRERLPGVERRIQVGQPHLANVMGRELRQVGQRAQGGERVAVGHLR